MRPTGAAAVQLKCRWAAARLVITACGGNRTATATKAPAATSATTLAATATARPTQPAAATATAAATSSGELIAAVATIGTEFSPQVRGGGQATGMYDATM